jgi:G6PDH family F420-dependent oxidoreductase
MTTFGYFLSSEEHGPRALLEQAKMAEAAGFTKVAISDHFHPWMESQGESPFVWTTIGAIAAATDLEVTTAVTCPIIRIHPAILAQATATASSVLQGRFRFGIGTGERLNEHVLGQHWPPAEVRREMLDEAMEVLRRMWTGEMVTHRGQHYTVENAQIFTTPESEIPIMISCFGPEITDLAARTADGFITTHPDSDTLERYRAGGGTGPAMATTKVCWAPDEETARKTVMRLWASSGVPGQAMQELAVPTHFEEAAQLVTADAMAESIPCGPDPEVHASALRKFLEAGFDEVHISQVGDQQQEFFDFFTNEVQSRL